MLYDITPPISERLAVWPGDTPTSREVLSRIDEGASVTLSTLRATVHLGAHADAPSHYDAAGASIDERDLKFYLGPCQLIRVDVGRGERITREHITTKIQAHRILFHTGTYPNSNDFTEDFAAIDPLLLSWLAEQGVRLVGIDTPSVDPFPSKALEAHRAFARLDMAILEGLRLDNIPAGLYELIALPLRLVGFDASPVRAILRTLEVDPDEGKPQ